MLEFNIWILELIFVLGMFLVGVWRKRGLWFLFGMVVGAFSLLDLSANNLTVTFITSATCGVAACTVDVTLPSFMYFIPIVLIVANFGAIVQLRKQIGRGAM
jgi:hypothetical protein